MVRFASLVAFAGCIVSVCAQDLEPYWPINGSIGGLFDELPRCSKLCMIPELEASGCSPLDLECYCAWPSMHMRLDLCSVWYCTIDEFYSGSYQYHRGCNTPINNLGPQLKKEIIVVATIALLGLVVRFITRLPMISVKWGADDWLALLLLLVGASQFAVIMVSIKHGFGQDIWLLTPPQISNAMKYYIFQELGYVLITFLSKITVLTFYLRIFPLGRIRKLIYLFIGVCICLLVSIFLATLLQCLPISAGWEFYLGSMIDQPLETCGVDNDSLNWAFGITNVILDGIVMVLPIPELMSLELKLRRKLGLLLIFSVGFLITGIGIVRLIMLLNFNFNYNKTVTNVKVVKWCGIEAFLSIAVTCFPQVHLLGKRIVGIWYKPGHSSQKSKPSFVSSHRTISTAKDTSTYENLEMGLK